jgi:translation initiation factor 3 subunit H
MGAYQTLDLVDTFAAYSASISRCVCLVVDPDAAAAGAGGACLRAVKLSDAFLAAHRKAGGSAAGLGAAALAAAGVTWRDVFVELPVAVHASPLALALARSMLDGPSASSGAALDAGDAARLALGAPPSATRTVEHVADCLDDLGAEAARLSQYHRALLRAQQAAAAFAAKRRQENAARRAAGEPPLPEEDPTIGRPPAEPSPVDGFLITAQVAACCDRLGAVAGGALEKLAMFEALERAG